jgi:ABC-type methionine transport system permease subunit
METAKKSGTKAKKKTNIAQISRALFFIILCLFIVNIYYLSTKDQLLPQILKAYSALVNFSQSIPTPILMLICYSIVIFYIGYLVGMKKKK